MKQRKYTNMDFLDTSREDVTEEQILDYLAQIIASIYRKEVAKKKMNKIDNSEVS